MSSKNIVLIEKILKYCDRIENTMDTFGRDIVVFKENAIFRDACGMNTMQIGELSNHLSDEFKSAMTEIPWKQIRGMRNLFAHDYDNMNYEEVWETITGDVPALKAFCKRVLLDNELLNQPAKEIEYDDDLEL